MQRRAAAVYFVLLMVLAGGAYGFMQVGMSAPEVDLDGPTYAEGDTLTVNGTTYTVTTVESETESGGHGGGMSVTYTGEVTFFNESNMESTTLDNGSTTQFQDGTYTVQIANGTNVSEFTLVEEFNTTAIIAEDPDATGIVSGDGDQQFVRFQNGSTVPLSEYLPAPQTASFAVGDEFFYAEENVTTTVDGVSSSAVSLSWNAPENQSKEFGEGANVTLAGQTYFGHFPSDGRVQVLPANEYYGQYAGTLSDIDYYHERQNGMWGIVLISFISAIVLISAAYMPNK